LTYGRTGNREDKTEISSMWEKIVIKVIKIYN
jgi:hypothetical protein